MLAVMITGGFHWGWTQTRYWVFLKQDSTLLDQAKPALSPQALQKRIDHKIPLDHRDYAISASALTRFKEAGIPVLVTSRWLHAVSVEMSPSQMELVQDWPQVDRIRSVASGQGVATIESDCPNVPQQGTHWRQLNMLGLDLLHRNGWMGKDIRIAVLDNGFFGVDELEAFEHIFREDRLIVTKDYVSQQESVFEPCKSCVHGTNVFSLLAARMPGQLMGSAPGASFLLFRTENDSSETNQEEDHWVAAAEFADSIGVDIISSSLGYNTFDSGQVSYSRLDLDGETAIITRAADIAAQKGILVVTSVGNEGGFGITAPADGKHVLAIGAVDECEEYAPISSRGPTADGRIKPDLGSMGDHVLMLSPEGRIKNGIGTSLAAPLVAGLAACLWEVFPNASRQDISEALRLSASQSNNPDNRLGYGIPNAAQAFQWLSEQFPSAERAELEDLHYQSPFQSSDLILYPNPNNGTFSLSYAPGIGSLETEIHISDLLGRRLATIDQSISLGETQQLIELDLNAGVYVLRVIGKETGNLFFSRKFIIR